MMFWIQVKQKRLIKATLVVCSRNRKDWSKLYHWMTFWYWTWSKIFLTWTLDSPVTQFFSFASNLFNVKLFGYNPVFVIGLLIVLILDKWP
jgi:hypothetical protein